MGLDNFHTFYSLEKLVIRPKIQSDFNILAHNTIMTDITVSIDAVRGVVTINLATGTKKDALTMRWCKFSDDGSTGFMTSFTSGPLLVTEVAAEHLVRIILGIIIGKMESESQDVDLSIYNHLGEELPDIDFLPPTVESNELETLNFVAQQDRLTRIFSLYEESGMLNTDCIAACQEEGILEDFLCLVQLKASGLTFEIQRP